MREYAFNNYIILLKKGIQIVVNFVNKIVLCTLHYLYNILISLPTYLSHTLQMLTNIYSMYLQLPKLYDKEQNFM